MSALGFNCGPGVFRAGSFARPIYRKEETATLTEEDFVQLGKCRRPITGLVLPTTGSAVYDLNTTRQQLEQEGFEVRSEDIARLSPLVYDHINVLGHYAFSLPEAVSRGELRPLRDPSEVYEEIA